MEHDDIYERHCKGEFEEIRATLNEVLRVLKGRNGGPGLCERVRNLERSWKIALGVGSFFVCAVTIELIAWGFRYFGT